MSTSRKDIENALMRGADSLRDTIDAANYKDYVLPLMFVKYLSDTYKEKVENLEKEYQGVRLERQKRYLAFTVAEDCSFNSLYEQRYSDNIGQLINMAMRRIESDNNQQLAGVLGTTDYNSENALGTREHKNAILRELLEDLYPLDLRPSQIEVKEGEVPADVIGDAHEYMIG
ncbi:MAG: type I restriction-modification system subunit M N-terminal domain-containing protein, partial [Ruminococcus sp.]